MIRICQSLSQAGYRVTLIGRRLPNSIPLSTTDFQQTRLRCFFNTGPLFYLEYNLRLLWHLLWLKTDLICAIDLDTILPGYFASRLKKCQRVYDAHELFCEMKEIVTRPGIYRIWKWIEQFAVPRFPYGYTVNQPIADAFNTMYGVEYAVVRNIAKLQPLTPLESTPVRYFVYQGAVNEGRCFETLIPAMQQVNAQLWICGEGNFLLQTQSLVKQYGLEEKVIFKGKIEPQALRNITRNAYAGITLFDDTGKSNYWSLANRFFDYLHAGIPQLCVDFPVYRQLNASNPFALLVNDTSAEKLSEELNNLLHNTVLYQTLQSNCQQARLLYHWDQESLVLLQFYERLFAQHT